jgi:hypothetical protein
VNCLELAPKEEEEGFSGNVVLPVGLYTFTAVYTGRLFLGCSIISLYLMVLLLLFLLHLSLAGSNICIE